MTPWKVKKSLMRAPRYSCTLEPLEREIVGNLAATVADALMQRARSAPRDELAEMMDIPAGNKEAPTDPSMARLLPDFEKEGDEEYEGDNALLRSLHETDIISGKLRNLQVISEALGPTGSVELNFTAEEVHPYLAGINDLRLYLSELEQPTDPLIGNPDAVLEWLAYHQESLLDALMGQ